MNKGRSLSAWSLLSSRGRQITNKQMYSMSYDKKYCGERRGKDTGSAFVCASTLLTPMSKEEGRPSQDSRGGGEVMKRSAGG